MNTATPPNPFRARHEGRANREEFWRSIGLIWLVGFVGWIANYVLFGGSGWHDLFTVVLTLATILPGISVGIRRLHDLDYPGWYLLVTLIPIVGAVVMIFWGCQPGTPGPNRYGPDPLGHSPAANGGAAASVKAAFGMSPPPRDVIAEIERLANLKANGNLSEAEFEVMKAQALGQGRSG